MLMHVKADGPAFRSNDAVIEGEAWNAAIRGPTAGAALGRDGIDGRKRGTAARRYANAFARNAIADDDDTRVIARIRDDLLAERVFIPDAEIRNHLKRFAASAEKALRLPARTRA